MKTAWALLERGAAGTRAVAAALHQQVVQLPAEPPRLVWAEVSEMKRQLLQRIDHPKPATLAGRLEWGPAVQATEQAKLSLQQAIIETQQAHAILASQQQDLFSRACKQISQLRLAADERKQSMEQTVRGLRQRELDAHRELVDMIRACGPLQLVQRQPASTALQAVLSDSASALCISIAGGGDYRVERSLADFASLELGGGQSMQTPWIIWLVPRTGTGDVLCLSAGNRRAALVWWTGLELSVSHDRQTTSRDVTPAGKLLWRVAHVMWRHHHRVCI